MYIHGTSTAWKYCTYIISGRLVNQIIKSLFQYILVVYFSYKAVSKIIFTDTRPKVMNANHWKQNRNDAGLKHPVKLVGESSMMWEIHMKNCLFPGINLEDTFRRRKVIKPAARHRPRVCAIHFYNSNWPRDQGDAITDLWAGKNGLSRNVREKSVHFSHVPIPNGTGGGHDGHNKSSKNSSQE